MSGEVITYQNPELASETHEQFLMRTRTMEPKERLVAFARAHQLLSRAQGATSLAGRNFDLIVEGDFGSFFIVMAVPEERREHLYELYIECDIMERPALHERLLKKETFTLFFDIDWKLVEMQKSKFDKLGEVAKNYFEEQLDVLLMAIESIISEQNLGSTTCKIYARTCYKYHIYYPEIAVTNAEANAIWRHLIKKLPKPKQSMYFDWAKVIDTNVYSNGLRVPGAPGDHNPDEVRIHNYVFDNCERGSGARSSANVYSQYYSLLSEVDGNVDVTDLMDTRLSRPANEETRAEQLAAAQDVPENVVRPALQRITQQALLERVRLGLFQINNTPSDLGENWNVVPEFDAPPKFVEDGTNGHWRVTLVAQICPFKGAMHNRCAEGKGAVYCRVFRNSLTVSCWKCSHPVNGDSSLCRTVTYDTSEQTELDYPTVMEKVAMAIVDPCSANVSEFCALLLRKRFAVTPSDARANAQNSARNLTFFYFDPKRNQWVNDMNALRVELIRGIIPQTVQEVYRKIKDVISDKASLRKTYLTLMKDIKDSKCLQPNIFSTIASEIESYWRNVDPEYKRRAFIEQLNKRGNLLCFKNKVLEFHDDKPTTVRDGRPDDRCSLSTHYDYCAWDDLPVADQELILEYLEILMPVKEERDYFLLCQSRMLNGDRCRTTFYFAKGYGGDGKSFYFSKLLSAVFGDYYGDCPASLLLSDDKNSASGPREELMNMADKRVIIYAEADSKKTVNNQIMKILSGGDRISARGLHQKQTHFTLKATHIMYANDIPEIVGDEFDDGIWRRPEVFLFRQRFLSSKEEVERRRGRKNHEFMRVRSTDNQMAKILPRLARALMSYLVKIYDENVLLEDFESKIPPQLKNLILEKKGLCNQYNGFLKSCMRESTEGEAGSTTQDLYQLYKHYFKIYHTGGAVKLPSLTSFTEGMENIFYNSRRIQTADGEENWPVEVKVFYDDQTRKLSPIIGMMDEEEAVDEGVSQGAPKRVRVF